MRKLIKVEYTGKSSQGFFANVTYVNLWGKLKIREAFCTVYNFETLHYCILPIFIDTNSNIFHNGIREEMIRQYELNN